MQPVERVSVAKENASTYSCLVGDCQQRTIRVFSFLVTLYYAWFE